MSTPVYYLDLQTPFHAAVFSLSLTTCLVILAFLLYETRQYRVKPTAAKRSIQFVILECLVFVLVNCIRNFEPASQKITGVATGCMIFLSTLHFTLLMSDKYALINKIKLENHIWYNQWWHQWITAVLAVVLIGPYILGTLNTFNGISQMKAFGSVGSYSLPCWYVYIMGSEVYYNVRLVDAIAAIFAAKTSSLSNPPPSQLSGSSSPPAKPKSVQASKQSFSPEKQRPAGQDLQPISSRLQHDITQTPFTSLGAVSKKRYYIRVVRYVLLCLVLDASFLLMMLIGNFGGGQDPVKALNGMAYNQIATCGVALHLLTACRFTMMLSDMHNNMLKSSDIGGMTSIEAKSTSY
ncbi:hypothetical protein HDV03_003240 [Kappamyces sp. JEL0829]|nr:hypothetical protein HDV03_003240 [Kappamyces sp. JEL0829]